MAFGKIPSNPQGYRYCTGCGDKFTGWGKELDQWKCRCDPDGWRERATAIREQALKLHTDIKSVLPSDHSLVDYANEARFASAELLSALKRSRRRSHDQSE